MYLSFYISSAHLFCVIICRSLSMGLLGLLLWGEEGGSWVWGEGGGVILRECYMWEVFWLVDDEWGSSLNIGEGTSVAGVLVLFVGILD